MPANAFLTGEYVKKIPHWHAEDAPWKAAGVLKLLQRNGLTPHRIGEVGCGSGEVLRQLQQQMDPSCEFLGYDIAPEAIALSETRQNDRLMCRLADVATDPDAHFDVLLMLDVLEHQENYFGFLRDVKPLAPYKVIHQVLDLSAQAVIRQHVLPTCRRKLSDLHFFTKDLVLEALHGEDYEVLDWYYGSPRRYQASGVLDKVRQLPRTLCFKVQQDLTARLLGGYSLFVLAR